MLDTNAIYQKRINHVIDHINDHLTKSFSLDELAELAHFSSYHFHRIFFAVVGESVNSYTNRVRLEKSAKLLKFSSKKISQIAFECGYSSPATFSRSFQKYFEVSPSMYRKEGIIENSKICKELHPMAEYLYDMSIEEKESRFPIEIKELPVRKVAYVRVNDSFKEGIVIQAFEKLISWAKSKNLFSNARFFGMSLDDPMVTAQQQYRYEACMELPKDFKLDNDEEIQMMDLPACKYATSSVSGDIRMVATAMSYMYNDWLINSQYEPEHQYGLEYFMDKQKVCHWDHFDLELYIPVKSLKEY